MSKLWVAFLMLVSFSSFAQDTLPRFTVTTRGYNKAIISWTNNYTSVTQINIQRSFDSTKGFRTILNVPDPSVPQNGFVDTKAPAQSMFYRLFIVLEDGNYIFSTAQRPFWDTPGAIRPDSKEFWRTGENNNRRIVAADNMSQREVEQLKAELREATKKATAKPNTAVPVPNPTAAPKAPERYFIVKKKDSILFNIPEKGFKKFIC